MKHGKKAFLLTALIALTLLAAGARADNWYFDDTGIPNWWGQTWDPPYWEQMWDGGTNVDSLSWHDLDHLQPFYAQSPQITFNYSGYNFFCDIWLANNYEDSNNDVTLHLCCSNTPGVPGTIIASATVTVTNGLVAGEIGEQYRFNFGVQPSLNLLNQYLVVTIVYEGTANDCHIYHDNINAPSGLHAEIPTDPGTCDDFELDQWTFDFLEPAYDGVRIMEYSLDRAHSPIRCIEGSLSGGGSSVDADMIWAERTYELTEFMKPDSLSIWYSAQAIDVGTSSLRATCYVQISAMDDAEVVIDSQIYCLLTYNDTSIPYWLHEPDWIYQEGRPEVYETGAPDYTRGADESIQPPPNYWYKFQTVGMWNDLEINNWNNVAAIRVRLVTRGVYLYADAVGMYWDDFCLTETTTLSGVSDQVLQPRIQLEQNYPNPFNPETEFSFWMPSQGLAVVRIHDLRGVCVATLLNEPVAAGRQTVHWNGRDRNGRSVASGTYMYTVQAGGERATRRLTLLK